MSIVSMPRLLCMYQLVLGTAAAFTVPAFTQHTNSLLCSSDEPMVSVRSRLHKSPQASIGFSDSPVFLTREAGKNDKLRKLLQARDVPCFELPCIACEVLPSASALPAALGRTSAWVVVTSPEAAAVLIDGWKDAGKPELKLASVGKATAEVLEQAGLPISFVPSKATAKTLAKEIPLPAAGARVLYPCSALAARTLQEGLESRGFVVERLETYTTKPADWDADETERARQATVAAFASPSAVRVWQERVGTAATAVCIGETSAQEARAVGFQKVLFPESPGVDSWADEIANLRLAQWQALGSNI